MHSTHHIERLVGVLGGRSFISHGDPILDKDSGCPEDILAKARILAGTFSTTNFHLGFAPMARLYAEPTAIISGHEAEFLHGFYLRPYATTVVRLKNLEVTGNGSKSGSVCEDYSTPGCAKSLSLARLTEQIGDAPLYQYLKTENAAVFWHALKAWKELKEEDASHPIVHLKNETEDQSAVILKGHTVLAVGPSGLIAAMGIVALGEKRKKKRHSDFIKQLLTCDPNSFAHYDIRFDSHGVATSAKCIPFPAEEPVA